MAEAKKNLRNECADENPEKLCGCIADELEKAGQSAKQIDKLATGKGMEPEVSKAALACGPKQ